MKLNVPKIKREMKMAGIDINILAFKCGCTVTNLYIAFKREQTKLPTIQKIADALNLDAKDILI